MNGDDAKTTKDTFYRFENDSECNKKAEELAIRIVDEISA
tara:strand:+ start:5736 stop:5855 length:120 start_codon:yes stop_codon:yes gene_type:complete